MGLDFSSWYRWGARTTYPGIRYPGIYVVAISQEDLSGRPFSWRPEVVYVGMTNSVWGLDGRLWQFDNTISLKRCEHGGADRLVYRHPDYNALTPNLYVALWHIVCDPTSDRPSDLRCMGEVARAEYECWAQYRERFDQLPEFNRKKASPKYTKLVREF